MYIRYSLVPRPISFVPRPRLQGGKGSGIHQALSGAWWCFISEFSRTNQIHTMCFSCDYHVTSPHSHILHACERGWCVAMPNDVVMPIIWYAASCVPQKVLDVYQTFPSLRVGSRLQAYSQLFNTTRRFSTCNIKRLGRGLGMRLY